MAVVLMAIGNPGHRETVNVLVLGTSSVVGKTLITLALCRWLSAKGKAVAPFKPMSMSSGFSSFRTRDGGEIHVHQALQAIAANLEPHVDMNPLMLKMTGDRLEVIAHGAPSRELADIPSAERHRALRAVIADSHRRLASNFDYVVIEGCGSPVELNIKERDISNLWVAEAFNARCVLVGSAEKTGVFASLIGTMSLLADSERSRIAGFIINRFHGSLDDFADGVRIIEERTGLPCFGVIPFLPGVALAGLDEETTSGLEAAVPRKEFADELDRWTDHVVQHLDLSLLDARVFAGLSSSPLTLREPRGDQATR